MHCTLVVGGAKPKNIFLRKKTPYPLAHVCSRGCNSDRGPATLTWRFSVGSQQPKKSEAFQKVKLIMHLAGGAQYCCVAIARTMMFWNLRNKKEVRRPYSNP